MYRLARMFAAASVALATIAFAAMPAGEYLDGKDSKAGVILAHGRGGGAESGVVGPLRSGYPSGPGLSYSIIADAPTRGRQAD